MPVASHLVSVYFCGFLSSFVAFFFAALRLSVLPPTLYSDVIAVVLAYAVGILASFKLPVQARAALIALACAIMGAHLGGVLRWYLTWLAACGGTVTFGGYVIHGVDAYLCTVRGSDVVVCEAALLTAGLFGFWTLGAVRIRATAAVAGRPEVARLRLGTWSFALSALVVPFAYAWTPLRGALQSILQAKMWVTMSSLSASASAPLPDIVFFSAVPLVYFCLAVAIIFWLKSNALLARADERILDQHHDVIDDTLTIIDPFLTSAIVRKILDFMPGGANKQPNFKTGSQAQEKLD